MAGRHCDITRGEKKLVTARMEQLVWLGMDKNTGPQSRPTPSTGPGETERHQAYDIAMDVDIEMSGQVSCLDSQPSSLLILWIYCVCMHCVLHAGHLGRKEQYGDHDRALDKVRQG